MAGTMSHTWDLIFAYCGPFTKSTSFLCFLLATERVNSGRSQKQPPVKKVLGKDHTEVHIPRKPGQHRTASERWAFYPVFALQNLSLSLSVSLFFDHTHRALRVPSPWPNRQHDNEPKIYRGRGEAAANAAARWCWLCLPIFYASC